MQIDQHDHQAHGTRVLFQQAALECAAAPVKAGHKTIDGNAVVFIVAYANTLRIALSDAERLVGQAFNIFAAAVRREQA
jgi:hypothetical protein